MKYKTCPDCGASLDFGERCRCMIPRCPLYDERIDQDKLHEIHCKRSDGAVTATMRYDTSDAMLKQYMKRCCDNPFTCNLRMVSSSVPWINSTINHAEREAYTHD